MEYSNTFIQQLDQIFPLLIFVYGAVLLLILNLKVTQALGAKIVPRQAWHRLKSHSSLAWISFFVGGLWSLQNLWFS